MSLNDPVGAMVTTDPTMMRAVVILARDVRPKAKAPRSRQEVWRQFNERLAVLLVVAAEGVLRALEEVAPGMASTWCRDRLARRHRTRVVAAFRVLQGRCQRTRGGTVAWSVRRDDRTGLALALALPDRTS